MNDEVPILTGFEMTAVKAVAWRAEKFNGGLPQKSLQLSPFGGRKPICVIYNHLLEVFNDEINSSLI